MLQVLETLSKICVTIYKCTFYETKENNVYGMVEEASGSDYESLQHFITDSSYGSAGLMLELANNNSGKLQLFRKIGIAIDKKAHLKKLKKYFKKPLQLKNSVILTFQCNP